MEKLQWFKRKFDFGAPAGMLPFYLERLKGTATRIHAKVNGVPDDVLSNKLDGKWSVKQNIGHLAEVDEIALKRIDEIINGKSPMSPAVFEPKQDYNARPVSEVLEYFRTNRLKCLIRYQSVSEEDLTKASLHPRLKVMMTPIDLAFFDAEHDDHHLVRMDEILSLLAS
ncbi:MAG TPA: DinB family protein [Cyclobacteriaceae bacterium]|nr:DinB family protein [Cyclobacteriaceae bacterium]